VAEDPTGDRSYDVAPTEVLRLAVDSGCTAYNSQYTTLARQLDMPSVTCDGQVLEKFPKTAVPPGDFLDRRD